MRFRDLGLTQRRNFEAKKAMPNSAKKMLNKLALKNSILS
jgi:hypothetical protein